jgi:cytochrome P450
MLSQHPDVYREARKQVLDVLSEARDPTYEDLKSLPLVLAIFNETLRLYPSGAFR